MSKNRLTKSMLINFCCCKQTTKMNIECFHIMRYTYKYGTQTEKKYFEYFIRRCSYVMMD